MPAGGACSALDMPRPGWRRPVAGRPHWNRRKMRDRGRHDVGRPASRPAAGGRPAFCKDLGARLQGRGRGARPLHTRSPKRSVIYCRGTCLHMVGTAVKILIGVAIGIAVVIGLAVALFMAAIGPITDLAIEVGESEAQRDEAKQKLAAYPESVEFVRLHPDYTEEVIGIPPNFEYELRAIEDNSVFGTDTLKIEYNAETGRTGGITYLCTDEDGYRQTYSGGDLAEAMAGVCDTAEDKGAEEPGSGGGSGGSAAPDADEQGGERQEIKQALRALPESAAFIRLHPEYREDLISIIPPSHQYELRAIDESGGVFETDSLRIEYNSDTGSTGSIMYLCTDGDGYPQTYSGADLAEVMAGVCG